jgi:hypothetical protein
MVLTNALALPRLGSDYFRKDWDVVDAPVQVRFDAIFNEEEEGNSKMNLLYLTDSKIRYEDTIAGFKAKKYIRAFLYLVICHIRLPFGH